MRARYFAVCLCLVLVSTLACRRPSVHEGRAEPEASAEAPASVLPAATPVFVGSGPPPPPGAPLSAGPSGAQPAASTRSVVIGTVTGRIGSTLLVQPAPSMATARVEPAANIAVHTGGTWDGIQVGDHIDGFGEADSNGVLKVASVDVNVTQVWGTIAAVSSDAWFVTPDERHTGVSIPRDSEGRVRVTFNPAHPLKDRSNRPIPIQTLLAAKPGTVIMVVGVRAPSADSVTAETLIGTGPLDSFGP